MRTLSTGQKWATRRSQEQRQAFRAGFAKSLYRAVLLATGCVYRQLKRGVAVVKSAKGGVRLHRQEQHAGKAIGINVSWADAPKLYERATV
jgi:hypothetical protein